MNTAAPLLVVAIIGSCRVDALVKLILPGCRSVRYLELVLFNLKLFKNVTLEGLVIKGIFFDLSGFYSRIGLVMNFVTEFTCSILSYTAAISCRCSFIN